MKKTLQKLLNIVRPVYKHRHKIYNNIGFILMIISILASSNLHAIVKGKDVKIFCLGATLFMLGAEEYL
jgi:hypothetical protein